MQSFRGARHNFRVSAELTEQLKQLSRSEGVTLFMTLLAAFQTLLWRYSGQEDMVVGARRGEPEPAGDGSADRVLCEHAGAADAR